MSNRINLIGKKFGRLTVLEYAGNMKWICSCECGTVKSVSGDGLRRGLVLSCGCLCKEHHFKTHGDSYGRIYKRYKNMLSRCSNKNNTGWKNYGGRGITVCDEWRNDYQAFKKWSLSHGFDENLTLDRIDNNGAYSPDNCRFVDRKEQARNRRDNRVVALNGEKMIAKEWAEKTDICYMALLGRLKAGWTCEQAVLLKKQKVEQDPKTGRFIKCVIPNVTPMCGVIHDA